MWLTYVLFRRLGAPSLYKKKIKKKPHTKFFPLLNVTASDKNKTGGGEPPLRRRSPRLQQQHGSGEKPAEEHVAKTETNTNIHLREDNTAKTHHNNKKKTKNGEEEETEVTNQFIGDRVVVLFQRLFRKDNNGKANTSKAVVAQFTDTIRTWMTSDYGQTIHKKTINTFCDRVGTWITNNIGRCKYVDPVWVKMQTHREKNPEVWDPIMRAYCSTWQNLPHMIQEKPTLEQHVPWGGDILSVTQALLDTLAPTAGGGKQQQDCIRIG